jgi:hypothetical protein
MMTITNNDISGMSDAEICVEIALRRGLESKCADEASPYIGWIDIPLCKYFDIRFCTESAAAWELLEWARSHHLCIVLADDEAFPAVTNAIVSNRKQIQIEFGSYSNIKRAFAVGVLYYLREAKIGESNVSWKYED